MEEGAKYVVQGRSWKRIVTESISIVTLFNALVACCAFIKDVLLTNYLGTSNAADAFTISFFVPDMIGSSLIAGALSASCVPVFSALYAQGNFSRLMLLARRLLVRYTCFAISVLLFLYLFSSSLMELLTGARSMLLQSMTYHTVLLMLPIIALYPLVAIGTGLLQATGSFTWYASIPLVPHLILILVVAGCTVININQLHSLSIMSMAIVMGVGAMAGLSWYGVKQSRTFTKTRRSLDGAEYPTLAIKDQRSIDKNFILYLFILLSGQVVYFLERRFSASLGEGTVAGLNYAFRLSQLPIWVFAAAIYSIVLPSLSQDLAQGHKDKIRSLTAKALQQMLIISIPTTIVLFAMRTPLVSILFERGAFHRESVVITSNILEGYSLTIVGLSISAIGIRYFLAAGIMAIPLITSVISSIVNIAADYWWVPQFKGAGLGYGAAAGASVNAILLLLMLIVKVRYSKDDLLRPFARIIAANLPVACLFLIFAHLWATIPTIQSGVMNAIILVMMMLGGAAVYILGLWKLKQSVS